MNNPKICLLFLLFQCNCLFSISTQDAQQIAEKIWRNECAGSVEGLTCWNKGEEFGSFGIGHFIWYPKGQKEKFEETFPLLLLYLQKENVALPAWLKTTKKCPWSSREEFYQEIQSQRMVELRQLLYETRALQAFFIAQRLEKSFPQMISKLLPREKEKVTLVFSRLMEDSRGMYVLIDYLNFKGAGTSESETYAGQGWGLLQVLQGISPQSKNLIQDFVEIAEKLLKQRVQNSPPERQEKRWLQGWLNRIHTYTKR
jgi:hypothetical protein